MNSGLLGQSHQRRVGKVHRRIFVLLHQFAEARDLILIGVMGADGFFSE